MLDASEPVRCDFYRCTLPASVCATRTRALTIYPKAMDPKYPECSRCPIGAARLAELVAGGWRLPENLRNAIRPDQRAQISARARYYREHVWHEYAAPVTP